MYLNRDGFAKMIIILLLGIGILLPLTEIQGEGDEDPQRGLVTNTDGMVKKRTTESLDWENAEKNTPVNTGDRVRTYKRSRAELELLQLDIIRMAPETTIDIVKLYEETKDKTKETKISLKQGDIWAKLGEKDATMKFDISSPVAGVAITGTVLRMGVQNDSTTRMKVYSGEVKISNAPEGTNITPQQIGKLYEVPGPHEVPGPREVSMEEWVYIVKSMQQIVIGSNGQVKYVGSFSLQDKEEQSDWVKWNLEQDKQIK